MSGSLDTRGAAGASSVGRRLALVVAVTDYVDTSLRRLRAPAGDAAELRDLLADPEIGGFAVTSVINERAQQMRLAIEDFLSDRRPDDLLLVYLSCHGLVDARRRLYFAARDTIKDRLASSGVESRWLLDQLEDCRARRQVVVLDCCFSGAFARGAKGDDDLGLGERLVGGGRGRVVLTASRSSEYSFEGQPLEGEDAARGSVFTSALIEGIRTGRADTDGDGEISVDDAYAYAFEEVRNRGAQQTPQRWLYGAEGSILLARTPLEAAGPTPVEPPPPGPGGRPVGASPGPDRLSTGSRRRPAIVALAGLGVAAVVAAAILLLPGDDTDPDAGVPESGTFSQQAPWRLLIQNATADDGGPYLSCDVVLRNEDTGEQHPPWEELDGITTYHMHDSGTFTYEVNDEGCDLAWQSEDVAPSLPVETEHDDGDSRVFPSPGLVTVEVTDWTGSPDCLLRLMAADDGRLLDSVEALEGEGPFLLDGRGSDRAYVEDPGCSIRVEAAGDEAAK